MVAGRLTQRTVSRALLVAVAAIVFASFMLDSMAFGPGPHVPHPLLHRLYPAEPVIELYSGI